MEALHGPPGWPCTPHVRPMALILGKASLSVRPQKISVGLGETPSVTCAPGPQQAQGLQSWRDPGHVSRGEQGLRTSSDSERGQTFHPERPPWRDLQGVGVPVLLGLAEWWAEASRRGRSCVALTVLAACRAALTARVAVSSLPLSGPVILIRTCSVPPFSLLFLKKSGFTTVVCSVVQDTGVPGSRVGLQPLPHCAWLPPAARFPTPAGTR